MTNNKAFLFSTLDRLASADIRAWLFGGWAEELWGIISPRPHRDVDLLLPAREFTQVERLLAASSDVTELVLKRFSHKRAFLLENILVELILVTEDAGHYQTNFFSGGFHFDWPPDTFCMTVPCGDREVPVASPAALRAYRKQHDKIDACYESYVREK